MSAVSFGPAAPNRGPLRHGLAPQEEDGTSMCAAAAQSTLDALGFLVNSGKKVEA